MKYFTVSTVLLAAALLGPGPGRTDSVFQEDHPSPAVKRVLENGMTVITAQDDSSRATALQIYIRGGQGLEPEGRSGLAFLTTRLCLEIPDQDKIQDLMDQATILHMSTREDYSLVTVACLTEFLDDTLGLVASIMRKPLFSGIRIDRIKKNMNRRAMAQREDAPGEAHLLFLTHFFQGSPFSASIYGDEPALETIRKRDIQNFYEKSMRTGHIVAVGVSDLESEILTETIAKHLGTLPGGARPEPPLPSPPPPESMRRHVEKDTRQTLVAAGYVMPPLDRRTYILTSLLETLLGKGVGSRLWPLRTVQKLAYNVNSRMFSFRAGGLLEAYLETDADRREEAVAALTTVLDDLYDNGVNEEELAITRTYTRAMLLRDNESKTTRAATLGRLETLGLGFDLLEHLPREFDTVTTAEFNAFLREWLNPEKRALVLVGPGSAVTRSP